MQYHIETVDPKFLDLRQFPLSPTLHESAVRHFVDRPQSSNDSLVAEENDTDVRNESQRGRRRSSSDHLDILGPFEFSNALGSPQELEHKSQSWGDQSEAHTPTSPEAISHTVQSLNYADPWSHLDALECSGIRRHFLGLGLKPTYSANTTPRTSPREIITAEERSWHPITLDDFKTTYRYVEPSPVISYVQQVSPADHSYRSIKNINSPLSATSGTHLWPSSSPPDSAVVFPSNDSIPILGNADFTDSYRFKAPEAVQQLATAIKLEIPDTQAEHQLFQVPFHQDHPSTFQSGDGRQISDKAGHETANHEMEGIPLYQATNPPLQQDYKELRQTQPMEEQKIESDREIHTNGINIGGTRERLLPGIASSFPPTAGHFPEYWPSKQAPPNVQNAKNSSSAIALRSTARPPRMNRKSISMGEVSRSAIHGNGKSAPNAPVARKGRRAGPLSKAKATQAAIIRKNKSVCIRCKMMKQSCSGEVPCVGCRENLGAKIWKSPCVKADFLDIVEAGSCNYISQRRINHFTLDQSRRVTMLLPETFKLDELLELLKPRLSLFNIHARQLSGPLYTLNLAKCYDFLAEIQNVQESEVFELRDFIDNKLLKVSDWLKCVTEPCSMTESLALLAKWSNMPSRASYSIVSLAEGVSNRPMNVEDPEDRKEIVIAAQLSRIICRALEVAAYRFLQKELNTLAKKSNEEAERFVQELGQILLTLRWRISWWQILGDGSKIRDDCTERYIERVNSLTRVLYFYYCNAKKKLPSWTDPQSLKGVRSTYADTERVIFDDFPSFDSIDGFHEWMKRGHELIYQAGVQQRLERYY